MQMFVTIILLSKQKCMKQTLPTTDVSIGEWSQGKYKQVIENIRCKYYPRFFIADVCYNNITERTEVHETKVTNHRCQMENEVKVCTNK